MNHYNNYKHSHPIQKINNNPIPKFQSERNRNFYKNENRRARNLGFLAGNLGFLAGNLGFLAGNFAFQSVRFRWGTPNSWGRFLGKNLGFLGKISGKESGIPGEDFWERIWDSWGRFLGKNLGFHVCGCESNNNLAWDWMSQCKNEWYNIMKHFSLGLDESRECLV